jgi:hypothetical protein
MISRLPIVVFALLGFACGGNVINPTDGGGDSPTGDGGPGPDCPATPPSAVLGESCNNTGISCEYGGDPRWTCNTVATCTSGSWSVTSPDPTGCPTKNGPACPASESDIQPGMACSPTGTSCDYSTASATSFCVCTYPGGPVQLDGGGAIWQCSTSLAGCPALRPRLGAPCSQPNLECDYSVCGLPSGSSVRCDQSTSTWVEGFGGACAKANGG